MGWSGGTFTRTNGTYSGAEVWQDDDANGFGVDADRQDLHDQDIAEGINNCLAKDGQNAATGDIPFGGNKATGVGDATAAKDAMNRDASDARYIRRDGGSAATADIPLGTNKLTGVGDPTADQDAATKAYVDDFRLDAILVFDGEATPTTQIAKNCSVSFVGGTSTFYVDFDNAAPAQADQAIVCSTNGIVSYITLSTTRVQINIYNVAGTAVRQPVSLFRYI